MGRAIISGSAIDPALTFTRGSAAAFFDAAGVAREVANDVPRFTAQGLLLEGQRSTVNNRQRRVGGTGWSVTNVTSTTAAGPDGGGATASRLDEGAANAAHVIQIAGVPHTAGLFYTQSVILKAESCSTCQVLFASGAFGSTAFQNFDFGNGILGTGGAGILNPRIFHLGAGWYWISATALATATTSAQPIIIYMTTSASAARAPTYTGTGRTMLAFWGWEEDSAAFPSTAILAASEPNIATRLPERLSGSLTALGVTPAAGFTMVGRIIVPFSAPAGLDQTIWQVDGGSDATRYAMQSVAGGNSVQTRIGSTLGPALFTMSPGVSLGYAASVDVAAGTVSVAINGNAAVTQTGGPTSGMANLRFGSNVAGGANFYGPFGPHTILPTIASAAQLPALSLAA